MGIRLDELASIRSTVNQFLPWRGTVARTSVTVPMRVSMDNTRTQHLEHMPAFVRLPLWKLTLTDGLDLKAADQIFVEKLVGSSWVPVGTYIVLFSTNPESYSVETIAYGLQAADASGNTSLFTNTSVVFRNVTKNGDASLPASVFIYETTSFMSLAGGEPFYDWTVIFPSSLVFSPSGESIDANDTIGWSRFGMDEGINEPYGRPLTKPKPYPGLLPLSIAYFKETPGKAS